MTPPPTPRPSWNPAGWRGGGWTLPWPVASFYADHPSSSREGYVIYTAVVFFASARWSRRPIPWARRASILARRPRAVWRWFQAACVRGFTRDDAAHVAIGDGRRVLTIGPRGCRIHHFDAFAVYYPTLIEAFIVPVERPVSFDAHTRRRLARLWWLWGDNCVNVACRILRDAGYDIHARTPASLRRQLRSRGHDRVALEALE